MADEINYAFFEGGFVPLQDAKLSIMNHSFMYGTAVFEGIRGYWNPQDQEIYVFRLREHFERMADSMKIMYLGVKYSVDELCDIVIQLLQKKRTKD